MNDKRQIKLKTKIGTLYLVASEKGLCALSWEKEEIISPKKDDKQVEFLNQAVKELEEYLNGQRVKFSVRLDLEGTDFQKRVWKELTKIPFGKTCSYKDIAIKLNDSNASRAVGTANGKNPVCIIVPCHRVINANGELGGYSGGIEHKIDLLKLESVLMN